MIVLRRTATSQKIKQIANDKTISQASVPWSRNQTFAKSLPLLVIKIKLIVIKAANGNISKIKKSSSTGN